MSNVALETLVHKRQELLLQKEGFLHRINQEINNIEAAMETLSGKKVWEIEGEYIYDDQNPDYIKGSLEEM